MVKGAVKKSVSKGVDDESLEGVVVGGRDSKKVEKEGPVKKKMTAKEREELLIENFVGLQHAMTNLSIKFGALSDNITKLLQVFEESAKSFVSGGKIEDDSMLKKIDSLLDQNKTIAKGLILMEGSLRNRSEAVGQAPVYSEMPYSKPKPFPST